MLRSQCAVLCRVKYEFRRIFSDLFNNFANVGNLSDGSNGVICLMEETTDVAGCQPTLSESALCICSVYCVSECTCHVPVLSRTIVIFIF